MKIGMDISQTAHTGGVSTYTKSLAAVLSLRTDLEMKFLYYSLRKPYKGSLPNVRAVKLPPTVAELLFDKIRIFSAEQFLGQIDVFHSSDWVQPKTRAKKVTTYHDVIPIKFPNWSVPKIVEVHKRRLAIVEKEIDQVIAVSNSTKHDLVELSKIPENKITVVYEGVDASFQKQDEKKVANFRQKYKLPDNFILILGGIGERKNIARIKDAAAGLNVVITGETIPWINDDEMPLLYSSASLLLYPSLYEGFGLPILEAMACGTPVVTSNISSMPEVAGSAALLVDPTNVQEIKKNIGMILNDGSVKNELVKKGYAQAEKFTWQNCVDQTVEVYKRVLGK